MFHWNLKKVILILAGVWLVASVARARAAMPENVMIRGEIEDPYDRVSVTVKTDSGSLKIPRNSLNPEDEKGIRVGRSIAAQVSLFDVMKLNGIPFKILRTSGDPEAGAGKNACGEGNPCKK